MAASRSIDYVDSPGGGHTDTANASRSRRLASILLDEQQPYFTRRSNETTATAVSIAGYTMSVTFWMADPPELSVFSIHSSKPPGSKLTNVDFNLFPHVVGAEGPFVLIRARFFRGNGLYEYFMYQVGDGELPSLEPIPLPDGVTNVSLQSVRDFGIVLRGHGGHYLLAALCHPKDKNAPSESDYKLHTYSSENKTWSSRILPNPCPGVERIVPEKVITLGDGMLGWVDFSQGGLLVCDLRQDPPDARFMPLPMALPGNRDRLKLGRSFRDIVFVNGVLKFIEMEYVTALSDSSSDGDYLSDSDLIRLLKRKRMDEKPGSGYGWRAMTWSRMVSSNCWRKGCIVDVADILVDGSVHSLLQPGLRSQTVGKLTFRDLYSAFPTLSIDCDDILYLKSMMEPSDRNGWVVAVNLVNKTVKTLGA